MARLESLILRGVGVALLAVALLGLPGLLAPERYLTPVARALPADALPRQQAIATVRQQALGQIALAGLGGLVLLGLGGVRAELANLRVRLE
jgi:hypothetical protein